MIPSKGAWESEMSRAQPRREHLLNIAYQLFNAHGYHHTGIDTIMNVSGVSKTTMYKYFSSKEALILEVLKKRHDSLNNTLDLAIAESKHQQPDAPPHEHIDAIFNTLKQWIYSDTFYGCNFINASAEYSDQQDPIHIYAAKHKHSIEQRIEHLLCELPNATTLAKQISLILDGAIVTAQVRGDKAAIGTAQTITQRILTPHGQ